MVPAGLVLLAPDCGSWGIPARYTSMRTYHNAMGCPQREFVDRGNVMISRTALKTSTIVVFDWYPYPRKKTIYDIFENPLFSYDP